MAGEMKAFIDFNDLYKNLSEFYILEVGSGPIRLVNYLPGKSFAIDPSMVFYHQHPLVKSISKLSGERFGKIINISYGENI